MEIISSTIQFIGFIALALYIGSPLARTAWARVTTRRPQSQPLIDHFNEE